MGGGIFVKWGRGLLSAAVVGGCVWCLGLVQQAHREAEGAHRVEGPGYETGAPRGAVREKGESITSGAWSEGPRAVEPTDRAG